VYDNGATVGGTFKITFTTPRNSAMNTNALSNLGNDALMYSGYNQVWNTQTVTTVLTDIPFAAYDLYIYCDAAWANGGGSIAVTGQQTYYVKTKNVILMTTNTGAGYVQITNTTQASAISGPQGSGNYVKYSGLSGGSQTIALSALDMGNATTHRLQFSGFQIVQVVETPAVAGFTASPVTGAVPLAVTFTDTSTGSITNRYWDFGDGATSNTTATSVAHTYAAGTYTVSLIVSGADGASTNTQSNVITVSAPVAVPPPAPVVSIGISGNQNIISWTTVQGSGYVYSVYYSTNLLNGFLPLQADLADTVNSLTNAIIAPAAFYQIKAR
jgi:PKD repeat protein